jgi:choline-sulfatase
MDARDVEFLSALYDENVAYADDELRALWDGWCRARDPGRTLFAFVSDHGEQFMEHGELGHPASLHRELVAVPFIVAGPGVPAGVVGEPVSTASLPATLAELAGLTAPGTAQSPSLVARMRGPAGAPGAAGPVYSQWLSGRTGVFVESAIHDGAHAIRSAEPGGRGAALVLFDWAADVREERDLSGERADAGERLATLLGERRLANVRLAERFPSTDAGTVAGALRDELRALGYLGDGADDGQE